MNEKALPSTSSLPTPSPSAHVQHDKVVAALCAPYRQAMQRAALRADCGASDEAVEELIRAPDVSARVRAATRAFVQEHTARIVCKLFDDAAAGAAAAIKLVLELSGVAEQMRAAAAQPDRPSDADFLAEFDRTTLANLREILLLPEPPAPK